MRQRVIFWFWLPLFASWLLMTAEGPFVSAIINRMPDEVIMLAAQGIVVALAVTIESPIINLLATSTALVKDRPTYLLVRRFTIHWAIFLTIISILLAFTPLFDLLVIDLMQTPMPVAVWVRLGLQIMIFWSAAIAWRRFLQGVLIHFGFTRRVAWGTVARLLTSGGTAIFLATMTDWAGMIVGTTSLMTGVIAEAVFATIAVRPILNNQLAAGAAPSEGTELTYRELFWFHLPLASTSLLALLTQPMVTFSLARLDKPLLSLAAWPVVFQITLMSRAAAFAWPEVVIALGEGNETFPPIRRFTFNMAAALTLFMTVFIMTPLSTFYIFVVQDMTQLVGELARSSLILFLLYPALAVFISWLRGLLIKRRVTREVNVGMGINLLVTAGVLAIGLYLHLPGLATAAIATHSCARDPTAEGAATRSPSQLVCDDHLPASLWRPSIRKVPTRATVVSTSPSPQQANPRSTILALANHRAGSRSLGPGQAQKAVRTANRLPNPRRGPAATNFGPPLPHFEQPSNAPPGYASHQDNGPSRTSIEIHQ
jgi:hypothetical protein